MNPDGQLGKVADATAEEVLRVIYGDDLQGCAVSLDAISAVIRLGLVEHSRHSQELAELHAKGFEAIELLSTPPVDGQSLSAEDLRSLLGERLDKIRALANQILDATRAEAAAVSSTDQG